MADEATTSNAVTGNVDNPVATTTYVVGEHSVYNSVEELYKGAIQKEGYIQTLKQELAEARATIEELSKNETIVEKLKQIRENKMDNTENTNPSMLPEEAIKQIALNAMQDYNKATEAESNLANCKQAVASINADVDLAMKNKAQELGCTVEYLEGIAKTSPKAFKSMFGIKETVSFDSVKGKVVSVIPKIGYISLYLQSTYGIIGICSVLFIVFVSLFILEILKNKEKKVVLEIEEEDKKDEVKKDN